MRALELVNQGRLREAIREAQEVVKGDPSDSDARLILSELLCFVGDFEKADRHLETASLQSPDLIYTIAEGRQLIRAAVARVKWFADSAMPDFLSPIDSIVELQLKFWTLYRAGQCDLAAEALERLVTYCDAISGVVNGSLFTGFRDLDDSTVACLEVLTLGGKYYWIPWHRIELLEFEPVKRLRDLLWRQAHIVVRQGPDSNVFVPVAYPSTKMELSDACLLGRVTDWVDSGSGVVTGIGQRTFSVADGHSAILELKELAFEDMRDAEFAW